MEKLCVTDRRLYNQILTALLFNDCPLGSQKVFHRISRLNADLKARHAKISLLPMCFNNPHIATPPSPSVKDWQ